MDDLKAGRAIARRYRNRRIGEFLKEIDLSEKKSTGITKILRNLKFNGSPPQAFETNEVRDYLIVTIQKHKVFESNKQINWQDKILASIKENPSFTLQQMNDATGISMATLRRDIKTLKEDKRIKGWAQISPVNWK